MFIQQSVKRCATKMKLIKAFAVSAVIGTALCLSPSSQAFWGFNEKEPTYEDLDGETYQLKQSMRNKIYKSPGWVLLFVRPDGKGYKARLVDCKSRNCIYYTRIIDDRDDDKYIGVNQISCPSSKVRTKNADGRRWHGWFPALGGEEIAHRKFCK